MLDARWDGHLFTDAREGDLLISTSREHDGEQDPSSLPRILLGSEKWTTSAALVIDAFPKTVRAIAPLRADAGIRVGGDGDGDGGIVMENGQLVVTSSSSSSTSSKIMEVGGRDVSFGRDVLARCNLHVGADMRTEGSLSVGHSALYADANVMQVRVPRVNVEGELFLTGAFDAVGKMLLRPARADASGLPDKNKTAIALLNDEAVTFNRNLSATGDVRLRGDTRVTGGFDVDAHGLNLLRVRPDGVRVTRDLGLRGAADVDGTLRVWAGSRSHADVDVDGNAPSPVLDVREASVSVRRTIFASEGVAVNGDAVCKGALYANFAADRDSFDDETAFLRSCGLVVDTTQVSVHRDFAASCNMRVEGDAAIRGSFRVARAGEVLLAVSPNDGIVAKRSLNLTGDLDVKGDTRVVGGLRVAPDDLAVFEADGTRVDVNRPLSVRSDTKITGNFTVNSSALGRQGDELMSITDASSGFRRDVYVGCNLYVGDSIIVGTDVVVGGSNLSIGGNTDVTGELQADTILANNADVNYDLEVGCNLTVFGKGRGEATTAGEAALYVTDGEIIAGRDLTVRGGDLIVSDGDVRIVGNLLVSPDDGPVALDVDGERVRMTRNVEVAGNGGVSGNLDVEGETGLRVPHGDILIGGDLVVEGGAASNALVVDADRFEVARPALLRCNLDITSGGLRVVDRGNVEARGGSFAVRGPQEGSVPLLRVRRDEFVLEDDPSTGVDVPGSVEINRDLRVSCNLEVGADLDIGQSLHVDGELSTDGNIRVEGDAVVRETLEAAFFGGEPTFSISADEEGLMRVTRRAALECNLQVGGGLGVGGDLEVGGDTELLCTLTVRPEGAYTVAVMTVTESSVGINRDLSARCNLDVGSNAFVGERLDVGGDADVQGKLVVDTSFGTSSRALVVSDDKIVMRRPLDVRNYVSVSNAMAVADDLFVGGDARVEGNLDVRPASGDSPMVPSTTALAVSDAIVDVSRDLEARSNLDVGGRIRVAGSAHLESSADVLGRFRVFPDPEGDGGLVNSGMIVDHEKAVIARNLEAESNVIVGSNLTVRRSLEVGDDITVEGDADVTGRITANNAVISGMRVTGDTDMIGPVTIRPGSAEGSMGYTFTNVRTDVYRDLSARCNVVIDSNLVVHNDAVIDGNAIVRGNASVEGDAVVDLSLEVGGVIRGDAGMRLQGGGGLEIRDGDLALVGGVFSVRPGSTRVFHVTDDRVESERFLQARCNVSVGCNLAVGSNVTLGTDADVGRDLRTRRDLRVDRDVRADGDLVVIGRTTLNAPLVVTSASPGEADIFSARESGVVAGRNTSVSGDASVSGDVSIGSGVLRTSAAVMAVKADTIVDGSLQVNESVSITDVLSVGRSATLDQTLSVSGTTALNDVLSVDVGGARRMTVSSSNVVLVPPVLAQSDAVIGGVLEVGDRTTLQDELYVAKDAEVGGDLRVLGEGGISFDGGALRSGRSMLRRTLEAAVRKYSGAYRDVCRLRNLDDGGSVNEYGGAYAVRIEAVFDQREAQTHVIAAGRDTTGGDWRRCLPLSRSSSSNEYGGLHVHLEARSDEDVLEFRIVNGDTAEELPNFDDSNIDAIPFSFTVEVTHNARVPMGFDELFSEGTVIDAPDYYPATVLTQVADNTVGGGTGTGRGRVGVNVGSPREDLDVAAKVRAGDQFLALPSGGSAAAPAYSFAGDSNTGVFRPSDDHLALATGGVERVRVTSDGRMGVDVQTPLEGLHVRRKVRGGDQFLALPSGGSAIAPAYSFVGDSNTGTFRPNDDVWAVSTGGIERMRVTASGRLGVDVQAPEEGVDVRRKLQVRDQVLAFSGAQGGGGGEQRPAYSFTGDSNTGAFQPRADTWAVGTAGRERLRVLENGFVGIDLKEPAEGLDVRDKVQAGNQFLGFFGGDARAPAYAFTGDSNTGVFRAESNGWAVSTDGTERMRIIGDGNVGIDVQRPVEHLDVRRKVQARDQFLGYFDGSEARPAYSFTNDSNTGMFLAAPDTWAVSTDGAEHLRVTRGGRVGVNLKNPQEELDVADKVQAGNQFLGFVAGDEQRPAFSFTDDLDTGVFRPDPNNLAFSTGGTEHVRVLFDGKTGFRIKTPRENLDVADKVQAGDQFLGFQGGTAASPAFSFTGDSNTGVFRAGDDAWAVSTTGTERLRVQPDGRVGVNITAPAERLDVEGKVRARSQFLGFRGGDATFPAYSFTDDLNTGVFRAGEDRWAVTTDGKERLHVSNDGLISVRALSPSGAATLLDVDGKIRASDQVMGFDTDAASAPSFTWSGNSNTGMFRAVRDEIGFSTAGGERLRIDSSGRLGVNIRTPGERLDVDGRIRTTTQFLGPGGDRASAPSFAWNGDSSTGMFRAGQNRIGISTGGSRRMLIDNLGNVGVNMSASNNVRFDVDGVIRASDDVLGRNIRSASLNTEGFVTLTNKYKDDQNDLWRGSESLVPTQRAVNELYKEGKVRADNAEWTGHINNWQDYGAVWFADSVLVGMASRYRSSRHDRRFKLAYRRLPGMTVSAPIFDEPVILD